MGHFPRQSALSRDLGSGQVLGREMPGHCEPPPDRARSEDDRDACAEKGTVTPWRRQSGRTILRLWPCLDSIRHRAILAGGAPPTRKLSASDSSATQIEPDAALITTLSRYAAESDNPQITSVTRPVATSNRRFLRSDCRKWCFCGLGRGQYERRRPQSPVSPRAWSRGSSIRSRTPDEQRSTHATSRLSRSRMIP